MFELKCFYEDGTPITHFTQWDVNQTIAIDGEYTKAPMVHFANKESVNALCVQSTLKSNGQITVEVPNTLLTESYPILIYIYVMSNDSGRTILKDQIPVEKRAKPNDYEFKENLHVVYLTELENEVKELKNTMTTAVNNCNSATTKANQAANSINSISFTKATTRQNIVSGESLSTILGKIQKYLEDIEVYLS